MVSSFLSGAAPDLTTLIVARIFQGLGGGPIIPLSQAILWEIFPFHQRGLAMAVWGVGFILGPILGPTVGGYLADEWSWRWIFYINLPVGILGFLMASAFLFDPPYPAEARADRLVGPGAHGRGLRLPAARAGPGRARGLVRLAGDRRADAIVAVCALVGFLIRELMASEPILDLTVFTDRNFATGATLIAIVGFGMFSGMLLVAVFTQKLLGYDAWTSGLVLAPGGLGNIFSLFASGHRDARGPAPDAGLRLPAQRGQPLHDDVAHARHGLLGPGAARASSRASRVGFIFVPLSTLTLATIRRRQARQRHRRLRHAAQPRRQRRHRGGHDAARPAQPVPPGHAGEPRHGVGPGDAARGWPSGRPTSSAQGTDAFTAERRAMAMLYRETVAQAQLLAYADDFWLLAVMFAVVPLFLPLMRRIRMPTAPATGSGPERTPAHPVEEGAV